MMETANKLSAAMREGAAKYPQCTYAPIKWWAGQQTYAVCALGAAAVAIKPELASGYENTIDSRSIPINEDIWELVCERFGVDIEQEVVHPKKGYNQNLRDVITSLNDFWEMSIGEIADWLEEKGY